MASTSSSSHDSEVINPRIFPMSGIAYTSNGQPIISMFPKYFGRAINTFTEPTPTFSSSSFGRILYRTPISSAYYIRQLNDPLRGRFYCLPTTLDNNTPLALVVIVLNDAVSCFHIVCVHAGSVGGSYIFEDFCMGGRRTRYTDELPVGGNIIPNTAVSCGTKAHWLVSERLLLVMYDTAKNTMELVSLPPTIEDLAVVRSRRTLGIAGGELCYVLVTESNVKVYILENAAEDQWRSVYSIGVEIREDADWEDGVVPIVCREMPTPLRFESSCKLEVLLWVDGKIVLLKSELTADIMEDMSVFTLLAPPDNIADCVPIALEG